MHSPKDRIRRAGVVAAALASTLVAGAAGAPLAPGALVDHTPFDVLLQKYVRDGQVDYAGFRAEVDVLDAYLATLAAADLSAAEREQKLAFWINAYNAATIRLIVRHYGEIESIRDLSQPWDAREWPLAGETLSLDDVEHRKLRAELREPRIHFAIVCASVGCPDLANRAFTESNVDAELEAAARLFLQSPRHVRTEARRGLLSTGYVLHLSRIFKWFGEDFEIDGGGVAEYVARYADAETAAFIRDHHDELTIHFLDYDWSLNDTKASP